MKPKSDQDAIVDAAMKQAPLATKVDANDLLQKWIGEQVSPEHQLALVEAMINMGKPLIEQLAEDAGELRGDRDDIWSPEYEDAVDKVVEMASKLDEKTLGKWRSKLARKMGLTLRDFNNALTGQKKSEKGKGKRDEDVVYTFAGEQIGDHLVEYCYNPDDSQATFAVRKLPDGEAQMMEELVVDGVKYKPVPPFTDRIVTSKTVLFPAKLAKEKKTTRELAFIVEQFLKKYYLFDDMKIPRIIAYYILQTWLYDNFRTISYLRAQGDAGSGKSELMKRVGLLCYRLVKNNGAGTMASFFRMTETFKGTVYFDEMDLKDGGGADNEIVKFINLGAMDGNPIIRLEEGIRPDGSKVYQPTPFRSFCPKLFAMRKDFQDDAVGSRSISFRLMGKEAEELLAYGVPFEITDQMEADARAMRNLLLTWRMYEWRPGKRELTNDLVDPLVSSRINQVTMPLKSLATDTDGNTDKEFLKEITQLLREIHSEQVQERSMTKVARVVEAIWKIYVYPDLRQKCLHVKDDGSIQIKIGDVTLITNDIMDDMNSDTELVSSHQVEGDGQQSGKRRKAIESKTIGNIVRNDLGLHMLDRTNKGFFFQWDDLKMLVMGRKYGVLPDEEKINAARDALQQKPIQEVVQAEMIDIVELQEIDDPDDSTGE